MVATGSDAHDQEELGGTMLENLSAAENFKKIATVRKRNQDKKLKQ